MANRCDVCRRKPQYGHRVSHSTRRTNRRFLVNVQHKRMLVDGQMRHVYICTRCLRTQVKVRKQRGKAAKAATANVG
jgi:large subunit ribosomal protein L28